jgi:hypothetical protein
VPLPEASYMVTAGFIISKNVPYKGLINWRWDNDVRLSRFLKNKLLFFPCKKKKTVRRFQTPSVQVLLTRGRYESFLPLFKSTKCKFVIESFM